jgi:hypothetical protein
LILIFRGRREPSYFSSLILRLVGYYFERIKGGRILTTVVVFLLASVMWLIMDPDQPTRIAIKASQQSLIELHQDLSQSSR